MRVAALDLGTNTFLCLIAEGGEGQIRTVIKDEVETVRLGQGVDKSGAFHPEALERARGCLGRFRALIDQVGGVDRVLGVATSASRDVRNGNDLLRIGDEFNLPLRVINGSIEAQLSYSGACAEFNDNKHRLVIDIGGGSTELILGQGQQLQFAKSIDLGAVRMTERFVTAQPVSQSEQDGLRRQLVSSLEQVMSELKQFPIEELIAVAGTPTAIAALELGVFDPVKVNGLELSLDKLEDWRMKFASTSVEEKKLKYNLGGRGDIIFAGVSILCQIVQGLGQKGIKVSVKGLRYGLAHQLLSSSALF